VAVASGLKRGFVSNGRENTASIVDLETLKTVSKVPTGENPDGMLFEPGRQEVYMFNGRGRSATVFGAISGKVVATIPLPGKPEFAVVDGKGMIYDNIEDKGEIVALDAKSKKVIGEWKLAGCNSPSGMALDVAGARLFSACDGKKMAVTDAKTGKSLATVAIGDGPDGAGFDATHKLAFSPNGQSGTLSVIDASAPGYPSIEELPTQRGARTMTYDSKADRIYTVSAEFGPRPEPTPENPRPRPAIVPGSFGVVVIGR